MKIDHIGKLFTDTYRVAMHKHEGWEAVYYSSGHGFIPIGEEVLPFEAGEVFILPPGLAHSDWSEQGFQNIFFTFDRCTLADNTVHHFRDSSSQAVYHLLCQMYETYIRQDPNREDILNLSFELFFQYMYALGTMPQRNRYVEQIRNAVISNIANPNFSLKAVLEELHLNPNYARSLFVRYVGLTPLQFLMEKRMDYSKQLLASRGVSNYSIREVAEMCGFSDPCYFSRVFRKHTGVSPEEWERRSRSGGA